MAASGGDPTKVSEDPSQNSEELRDFKNIVLDSTNK